MNREQIIRMAREAGFSERDAMGRTAFLGNSYDIERFAALVAAAAKAEENEACAKAVEDYCGAWDDEGYALATAIRSRGQQ